MQFVDFAPVKLVFGPGRLEALRTEPLPGTWALLLTSNGRSMERIGALARVTAILEERGVAVVHMGVVEPNPTVSTVMKVAARMKDERWLRHGLREDLGPHGDESRRALGLRPGRYRRTQGLRA